MRTPQQLTGVIVREPRSVNADSAACELVHAFRDGYELDNLLPVLEYPNASVPSRAAWILSELGYVS